MGEKFDRMTAAWTPERLADFMEYRYTLLTSEPGHICAPAALPSYRPFQNNDYQHKKQIGSIYVAPWTTLTAMPPAELLHPNPFEPSAVRIPEPGKRCYRCWDSAIAVRECALRGPGPVNFTKIPEVRNINSHWNNVLRPAMSHIGPLGPGGRVLRPAGPFVLDLTAMGEFGWTLREAAHVLAHLRGDSKPEYTFIKERNKLGWHNIATLTELAYGLLFDVPIDVTDKNRGRPGEPDTYYGIELKSSTYAEAPMIRLPIDGREAPRPDETMGAMLFTAYIEPVPSGFMARSTAHRPEDRWANGPSMVACVGWECIDYISHMPLGCFEANDKSPVNYAIRAQALLPPDTHWAYLALAARTLGKPDVGDGSRWQYVRDWVKSPEYLRLRAQTPGLPCDQCYVINRDTEGAPKRPKGRRPKVSKAKLPRDWKEYDADVDFCMELIRNSVAAYEPLYYSATEYPKLDPRKRKQAHNAKMKALRPLFKDQKLLATALAKIEGKLHGPLTERQRVRYEKYKMEQAK